MLKRDPADYLRETKHDIHKVPRNFDPELHPFEANREYVRALNAAKLERVFAKPFLGALDGHGDSVTCCQAHPTRLSRAASSAADGQVKIWDLCKRECVKTFDQGRFVRSISFNSNGTRLTSVGDDKRIITWNTSDDEDVEPVATIASKVIIS